MSKSARVLFLTQLLLFLVATTLAAALYDFNRVERQFPAPTGRPARPKKSPLPAFLERVADSHGGEPAEKGLDERLRGRSMASGRYGGSMFILRIRDDLSVQAG